MSELKDYSTSSQARAAHYERMSRGISSYRRRLEASKQVIRPLTRSEEQSAIEAFVNAKGIRRIVIRQGGAIDIVDVRPVSSSIDVPAEAPIT